MCRLAAALLTAMAGRNIGEAGAIEVGENLVQFRENPVFAEETGMSNDHEEIRAVLDGYATAVYDKDVKTFADLYADDVHVFDAWMAFEAAGAESQRAMATEWFGSLGDTRVPVTFEDVVIAAYGDVAWAHAAVTFGNETANGVRQREQTNRFTFGFRKVGGAWRIAHQHSSLPVDFMTGTAIRERR